eukprot:6443935-Lingulodinium_polyedra.AAC.1
MHWPCSGHALAMHWPCAGHAMAMHWPCAGHALAMHWPCIGHAAIRISHLCDSNLAIWELRLEGH